jgi:hypothetical protein
MESRQGMTTEQAKKLLELAISNNKPCNVKIHNKDIRNKPGRAILKELLSDNKALIRPFKHGRDEIELLSNLSFWKTGCDFDITEVIRMSSDIEFIKPLGEKLSIPTNVLAKGENNEELFIIFSKKNKAVWGGSTRRWIKQINLASKWTERKHGLKSVGKINKIKGQEDAELLPIAEAHAELSKVLNSNGNNPLAFTQTHQTNAQQTPRPTAPAIPASLLAITKPQPSNPIPDNVDDDFIDLEALLGKDTASLKLAEEERKKAVFEYGKAKQAAEQAQKAVVEIKQKIVELDSRVQILGGTSILKDKPTQKKKGKKVFIRSEIQKVLMSHSRLDSDSILQHIKQDINELTMKRLEGSLQAMKSDGLAEKNEGGWALTKEGRSAKMRGN